ncbi:gamma-carotene 1'-hydroxylase CruF [Okeania sp. KiyG1]|uniref:gamma-carotene 1'-hydroxylase CruF n=1 Tax=Okeania sp. KiyG1 TaxID=2720165 RepID=UPI0019248D00|nr:carotenoid biosynthesis protein [Okeania sp. KiyG1]
MKQLMIAERYLLLVHILSTFFGLAGLLIVLPNPEIIISLPPVGQTAFQWSMAGGGATYIIFGALAVALYSMRNLGIGTTLAFMLPSVFLSLSSELLGTSTGFPFGDYAYLNGLGYKIAGLVPFTIPLSWFYMGLVCYLLARCGLQVKSSSSWLRHVGAIATGAVLLTAWDLVLDPAMSQAPFPFWTFQEEGSFFGMPYRNLLGWVGTGAIYMSVAAWFWRKKTISLSRQELNLPLITYLVNFAFGATITVVALDSRFLLPTCLSVVVGVIPAIALWWISPANQFSEVDMSLDNAVSDDEVKVAVTQVNMAVK